MKFLHTVATRGGRWRTAVAVTVIVGASIDHPQANGQEPANPNASPAAATQRALLNRYCVACHNQKLKTAGLSLDNLDIEKRGESAEVWEQVVRKLRTGAMPPMGMPRPDPASNNSLASYIESGLDSAAAAKP